MTPATLLLAALLPVSSPVPSDSTRPAVAGPLVDGLSAVRRVPLAALPQKPGIDDRWFGSDKPKHLIASGLLVISGQYLLETKWRNPRRPSLLGAAGATLAIGIGKEIRDARRPRNHFSLRDLTADLVGIGLAAAVVLIPAH